MAVKDKVAAARKAIAEGAEHDTRPVTGWQIRSDGSTPLVFGLEVRTRKPGAKWINRFTVWAKEGQIAQVIEDGIDDILAGKVEFDG